MNHTFAQTFSDFDSKTVVTAEPLALGRDMPIPALVGLDLPSYLEGLRSAFIILNDATEHPKMKIPGISLQDDLIMWERRYIFILAMIGGHVETVCHRIEQETNSANGAKGSANGAKGSANGAKGSANAEKGKLP